MLSFYNVIVSYHLLNLFASIKLVYYLHTMTSGSYKNWISILSKGKDIENFLLYVLTAKLKLQVSTLNQEGICMFAINLYMFVKQIILDKNKVKCSSAPSNSLRANIAYDKNNSLIWTCYQPS